MSPSVESEGGDYLVQKLSPLVLYTASVSLLGLVLFVWALDDLVASLPGVLLFAMLVLVAELTTSETLESKLAFSMASAVDFAVLLLWGPLSAALVAMLGGFVSTVVTQVIRTRRNVSTGDTPFLQKAAFNGATLGWANVLGGGIYLLAGGQVGRVALLSNLLPIVLAGVSIEIVNEALVVGVVAIQSKKPALQIWRQGVSWAVPISVLTTIVGGSGLALGYEVLGVLGLAVFFLPLALTIYAFRLYVGRTKTQMDQLAQTISELQDAQEEIRRQAAHLEALNAVIAAASAAPDLSRLLHTALDHVLQGLQLDMGVIWVADQIVLEKVSTDVGRAVHAAAQAVGTDFRAAFATEDCRHLAEEDAFAQLGAIMQQAGIQAFVNVPILSEHRIVGGLSACAPQPRPWTPEEIGLLEGVGHQLGAAAERLRLLREVRQHAAELETAIAQLQELDRLKNEFMQNASHELRTPLALIRGYMELMTDGEFGELPPNQRGAFEVIMRQTQMLAALVEDITLSLAARARSFRKEPVPMDDLVLAAADDFHVPIERAGLVLLTEVEAAVPMILAEPFYLRRVLDNLISNAIKFTPEGGAITLKLEQHGEQLVFEVSDTGIGISPAEQKHIFDRFYQVDGSARRKYGGMGLGLALVKEIVEAHGGTVTVESVLDNGTTFTVSLPVPAELPLPE